MDVSNVEGTSFNVTPDVEVWKMEERTFAQRLKEKFVRALGKTPESPGVPKVSLDLYYHTHDGKKDAEKIGEHFKTADIFIPEMLGWLPKRLDVVNKVSKGDLTPEEGAREIGYYPREAPYDFQLLQMIHKSKKPVAYIDYSRDDPRFQEAIESMDQLEGITQYWEYGRSFPSILQEIKRRAKHAASIDQKREEFMISNLKQVITTIVESNPKLRQKATKKGELRVLMSLGSIHTALSHLLVGGGNEVQREFSAHPTIYGYVHEAERRYRFGKDIDDAFAAKMLAEGLIYAVFYNNLEGKLPTPEARAQFIRKLAGEFSYQDVENIVQKNPDGLLRLVGNSLLEVISQKSPEQYAFLKVV